MVIEEVAATSEFVLMLVDVEFVIVELFAVNSPPVKLLFEIFVAERLVEVVFVIVPFATLIEGSERFVIERLVIVAEVRVALPPEMLAVVMFAVEIFEVVELDVEA